MDLVEEVAKELQCPLCLCLFNDPRNLPCSHTFCVTCIQEMYDNAKPSWGSRAFLCPLCRKSCNFSYNQTPYDLPKNYALASISEKFATPKISPRADKNSIPPVPSASFATPVPASVLSADTGLYVPPASAPPAEEPSYSQTFPNTYSLNEPALVQPSPRYLEPHIFPATTTTNTVTQPYPPFPSRSPPPTPSSYGIYPSDNFVASYPPPQSPYSPVPQAAYPQSPIPPLSIPVRGQSASQQAESPKRGKKRTHADALEEPESLVIYQGQPVHFLHFKVENIELNSLFTEWKNSLWFTPQTFRFYLPLSRTEKMLIPHWIFDVDCESSISAHVHHPGTPAPVPVKDVKRAYYNNVICLASQDNLPYYSLLQDLVQTWNNQELLLVEEQSSIFGSLVNSVKRFVGTDTSKTPQGILPAGIPVLPGIGWKRAFELHCRDTIEEKEQTEATLHLTKKHPNATISQVSVNLELREHFVHTLIYLPVWVCTYSYEGQQYHVLINGKNGKVVGSRPMGTIGNIIQLGLSGLQALENLFWSKDSKVNKEKKGGSK